MEKLQANILERVARGETLETITSALCVHVEEMLPGIVCSIVRVDAAGRLTVLTAANLPEAHREAFHGLAIGQGGGGCAHTIQLGRSIETPDIANDPQWDNVAGVALSIGLRACWSTPILGKDGAVLGAFAFYFREARTSTEAERHLVQVCTYLCAIAIERDQQNAVLHRLAYTDMLTGLPNRTAFNAVSERIGTAERPFGALLILDLDNLQTVNDAFGHGFGDCLIQAVAQRLSLSAAPCKVFRLNGDEFAVLVNAGDIDAEGVDGLSERILAGLLEPVDCFGRKIMPRATIGTAFAAEGAQIDALRQMADFALYHAKDAKRGGFVRYSEELGATMSRRLAAIREVDLALGDDRIDAYYQPIVRLDTGEIVGLEALFRVITETGQILPAGDYFEATSDVHTATRLTERMLDIVARDVRAWLDQGIWFQHVGINASSADFQSGRLHEVLREAFEREGVALKHVILEVTESVYMGQEGDGIAQAIQDLRAKGLRVALDDFGTGFASLTHLLTVPVDVIKIDKSFTARMEPDSPSSTIVEGLLGIAAKLGIRVVAEGVETQFQAERLRDWGCALGQGFYYSQAVDRDNITRLLHEKAQRRDADSLLASKPGGSLLDVPPSGALAREDIVVRYAILLCGSDWRVVSERRQFGRFATRSAALQCAMGLAREAIASGCEVELLHADSVGELRSFRLPGTRQLVA
ncbi:putative bifunctional diguanylate cyclase/phosphodiesterase [Brevundimonas staleyi]|uniref:Bifunctional diguanylate cyclase/phosphodiesterase n=1 Tax=Brevundimonas staleyi TaxID=74326 RepID=A0ABW0FM34_9CAUL